jgi:hypothetical protein
MPEKLSQESIRLIIQEAFAKAFKKVLGISVLEYVNRMVHLFIKSLTL